MRNIKSVDGHEIRLTDERWFHISTGHPEVADLYYDSLQTVVEPGVVYSGNNEELIAVRKMKDIEKFLVVIYKQIEPTDGFIITAFIISKLGYLSKKKVVWQLQK